MNGVFGARHRVPWTRRVAPVALACWAMVAAPAEARDFCAGMQQAIASATSDFVALKIANARGPAKSHPARALVPGGHLCEIRQGEATIEYRCRTTPANATSAQARAAFRRDVGRLRTCFAGIRARGHGDFTASRDLWGAVSWHLPRGLRAAVVFSISDEVVSVADRGGDEEIEETSSWIVIEKPAARR